MRVRRALPSTVIPALSLAALTTDLFLNYQLIFMKICIADRSPGVVKQSNLWASLSLKWLFFSLALFSAGSSYAQSRRTGNLIEAPVLRSFEHRQETFVRAFVETEKARAQKFAAFDGECGEGALIAACDSTENKRRAAAETKTQKAVDENDKEPVKERFHWKPALIQSSIFLGIQHGFRMTQPKTTRELGGPFFRDWTKSIKNLHGWNDSDNWFTNNIAHPLQGGLTGRIFVNNSDRAKKLEFGKSKAYWQSRFKAMIWSAAWSTQFEFGPLSEASIGNVGLREKNNRSTAAWTDLINTPIIGTGVVVGEDAIDKYILKNWLERNGGGRATKKIKLLRSVLTPTTSFANVLNGKAPWKRGNR